jgi:hypothetical protein
MIRYLTRYGTTRGIFGGSRAWTVVAVVGWSLRLLQRLRTDEPKVVYSEVLQPGEVLEIRHLAEVPKRR